MEVTMTAVKEAFKELKVRYGRCMEGLGSLHWEKVHSSTSRSYLLSFSPLCPWPTTLNICFSTDSVSLLASSPGGLFFSFGFLGPFCCSPTSQWAQQPVSGTGWQGASSDRGLLKIAGALLFPTMASGIYRRTIRKSCFFTLLHLCRESNPELCLTHFL